MDSENWLTKYLNDPITQETPQLSSSQYAEYPQYDFAIMPITLDTVDIFTLYAIAGNRDFLAQYLEIDLSGMEFEASALPASYEIQNLVIEDLEFDMYCEDDCVPRQYGQYMLHERRHVDRRC